MSKRSLQENNQKSKGIFQGLRWAFVVIVTSQIFVNISPVVRDQIGDAIFYLEIRQSLDEILPKTVKKAKSYLTFASKSPNRIYYF